MVHPSRRQDGICIFAAILACGIAGIARAADRIGQVTISLGAPSARSAEGVRRLRIAAPLYNQDTITTAATEALSALVDNNTVVKLDGDTVVQLVEEQGHRHFDLKQGSIEVFVADRLPGEQAVALVDPESEIVLTGTIGFASYSPQAKAGLYACEEHAMKLTPHGGKTVIINAGQTARVQGGALRAIEKLDQNSLRQQMKGLRQLGATGVQQSASVSRQRAASASVRQTLSPQPLAHDAKTQKQKTLADLLLARCADLDHVPANGVEDVMHADPNGFVTFTLKDSGVGDNDKIQFSARSCEDSKLKDVTDADLNKAPEIPLKVETSDPHGTIVELLLKGIDTGTAASANGGPRKATVAVQYLSATTGNNKTPSFRLDAGETQTIRFQVIPQGAPLPTSNSANAAQPQLRITRPATPQRNP